MVRRIVCGVVMGISITVLLLSCGKKEEKALMKEDMDLTVAPGDDFYQYANGGWLAANSIPADKTRYGSFDVLDEETQQQVKKLFDRAVAGQGDTACELTQKIGAFYKSGMDTLMIDSLEFAPLEPDLAQIDAILSPSDLVGEWARELPLGNGMPFQARVIQDAKSVNEYIFTLFASGYGMPERNYYFDESERGVEIQEAYQKMITKLFVLLGKEQDVAESIADDIYNLEKKLAEKSHTVLQMRDPQLRYNKMTMAELQELTPHIDWELYLQNLGVDIPEYLLVDNPEYFSALNTLLKEEPVNVWKDYLSYHLILTYAKALHTPVREATFDFYSRTLSGQEQDVPRWKRVIGACNSAMGEVVGQLYVKEYFPASSKERMLTMVENIRTAYRERLKNVTWMSDSTKEKAIEKLDCMTVKIGYPDEWKDYSDLSVSATKYAFNIRNAHTFDFFENMSRLGQPVDRTEWFMPPHQVNAYYNPTMNEIVFPAAILQPPFFYSAADDAMNYGAIGVVISHEITHGFDDKGRLFDKDGNLKEWWTAEDADRFQALTKNLVEQFSAFEPVEGYHINGELTLGENLADYGGLTISLHALNLALDQDEKAANAKIDDFTPHQRFFLSYAKVWRCLIREETLIRRVKEDVHSPAKYRVNGGVYNIDAFYDAFDVSETSPYYRAPEDRPRIW